jgi:predicted dehydrogenase
MNRIRLGMIGGGQGAFIGNVHRMASRLDDRYELVAGAFSSDSWRCIESARELGVDTARAYADYQTMAQREAAREDGIEVAVIVTPNHLHFDIARTMLSAGIHVICDKPLVTSVEDAVQLEALVHTSGLLFAVTYNYSGYPLVRQAREMVAAGELGTLRLVQVEYPQDWLATKAEAQGLKQAEWRTDPARAGMGGSLGDIGTHAFHLAEFVSGQQVTSLLAELDCFVEGRTLDDNAQILLRYSGGAKGSLWASQVAIGHENGLRLRVYGDKASLEWQQEDPNQLIFQPLGEPRRVLTRAGAGLYRLSAESSRLPAGHPEGFLEGFANLYREFADCVEARRAGKDRHITDTLIPAVGDGVKGVRFIEAAVTSARAGGVWQSLR